MTRRTGNVVKMAGSKYAASRMNATTHGILSRHAVLPWENASDYDCLLADLQAEYHPQGPTERHLVEELATIMWRKQRVLQAEAATFRRGLHEAMNPVLTKVVPRALAHAGIAADGERLVDAISATDADTAEEYADLDADQAMTERALELLARGTPDAYALALEALRDDTREWWADTVEADPDELDGEAYQPTAADLRRFLEDEVMPHHARCRRDLELARPLIRAQAFGEATDPNRLTNLARYETHLDRKLERTLAMLLKLADLRRSIPPA